MKYLFLSFCCLVSINYCFSQTISGNVVDIDGNVISYCNLLIKENANPESIVEFTSVRNGKFSIILKKEYETLLVEAFSAQYESTFFVIQNPDKNKSYTIDFQFKKNKVANLEEVVIVAPKKPYSIKKDTLTYNIESYKDPSDRKVQDVLKRLPGIDVNEKSGEIKYKGKSVETVTLDGDNLFGYNYSLGTKNINIDMLEQVEAIENYSENPLLKGIEGGEKVSLNLKLKKGKTDYSGNIDFGLGLNNDPKLLNNTNANILGVSKNYKSFGTFSYNNIGINHSPLDYFSGSKGVEQMKEKDFMTQKLISENLFSSILENERTNINNMFFSNYNSIFKIGKRISFKTNLYYLNDNIKFNQINNTENNFENESFRTSDNYTATKKPQFYRGDIEFKFNSSKNYLLEYRAKFHYEKINTTAAIIANESNVFRSNLLSENLYFNQWLLFTQKLNSKQAIQFQFNNAINTIPQNLILNDVSNSNNDLQDSNFKKKYFDVIGALLGSANSYKYSFSFGASYENNPFNSLYSFNSTAINNNAQLYDKKSVYNLGSINYTFKNWTFIPSYSIKFLNQKLEDIQFDEKIENDILFEPTLLIRYKINTKSFLSAKAGLNQNPFSEEYIFSNPIITNNRLKIVNTPTLEIQKSESYNLNYYNNDLYQQFILNIGLSYQKNDGNYFANYNLDENETILNNFYLKEENDNYNLNLTVEKLVSQLSTTFKITSTYTKSNYKNSINASDLRDNTNDMVSNEFTIRTAFDTKINFENQLNYNYTSSKSENFNGIINASFSNCFKLKYKHSSSIFSVFSADYFVPNSQNFSNDYLFLDFSIMYKPANKKYEFNLIGKNLLNNTTFSQIQTSDFSKSTFRNNLIAGYLFVNFTYNL